MAEEVGEKIKVIEYFKNLPLRVKVFYVIHTGKSNKMQPFIKIYYSIFV